MQPSGQAPEDDFSQLLRQGLARAGVQLARLRRIGEIQAALTAAKMRRRGQREAIAERLMVLYRNGELTHPSLQILCETLDLTDTEIRYLEGRLQTTRRQETETEAAEHVIDAPQARFADEAAPLPTPPLDVQASLEAEQSTRSTPGATTCPICRTAVLHGTEFCPTCGKRLTHSL